MPPCIQIGDFMKDIKFIFRGYKVPSGMNPHTEYMIGEPYLKNLKASGMFDIEVLEMPKDKPKTKKKKTAKKGKK